LTERPHDKKELKTIMGFIVVTMLGFYGLAACTIGSMVTSGFNAGLAVLAAVFEVVAGVVICNARYKALS
jgi:hypothetical protein